MRAHLVALVLVLLGGAVGVGRAQVPSPANSTVPSMIPVVGHDAGGVVDQIGEVAVIHRDLANNPIADALVVLDFSGCTELRLCSDPHDADAVVDCAARTIRKRTAADGSVRFRVIGWSAGTPGTPGSGRNAARVYADGVLIGSPSVAIYDLNGGGLAPADLSAWFEDFFSSIYSARGDYDNSGDPLGPSDFSMWLTAFFANGSILNCATACP